MNPYLYQFNTNFIKFRLTFFEINGLEINKQFIRKVGSHFLWKEIFETRFKRFIF